MPTITKRPFESKIQTILSELKSGYHAGELSKRESPEIPEDIYVIEDGNDDGGIWPGLGIHEWETVNTEGGEGLF